MNKQNVKKRFLVLILLSIMILFSSPPLFASSSENYCITADVIDTGGTETEATSENYLLFGSIGQEHNPRSTKPQ